MTIRYNSRTEGASSLFFSPDRNWVGFESIAGKELKKISLSGGKPQVICDLGDLITRGYTWGPDGSIILGTRGNEGLFRVSAQGSTPHSITTPNVQEGELEHSYPEFLPGGNALLVDIRGSREAGKLTAPISVFSLETGKWKRVGKGGYPCYSPTGHVLYKGPEHLINMALPFDVESLEPTGDAVRVGILEGVERLYLLLGWDAGLLPAHTWVQSWSGWIAREESSSWRKLRKMPSPRDFPPMEPACSW